MGEHIHEADESESPHRQYNAPALEKGLDILELLSGREAGLSKRDIAAELGRSVSEVFRMIECLARRSYLAQVDDAYVLGMKLFELAHSFPPTHRLLREALPRMEMLSQVLCQSCHVTVLSGTHQLVVAQVDAPQGIGFSVKVGATVQLLRSASGRVLLAFRNVDEARRLIEADEPDLDSREIKAALKRIAKVAADGHASMRSVQYAGLDVISFPVFDPHGQIIAALTVPYLMRLDNPEAKSVSEAVTAVAETAAELNRALGGRKPD